MAEGKRSVIIYSDLIHTVKKMSNEKAGVLFNVILEYINDLNPVIIDETIDLVFEPIKQQMKRDLKKWEAIKEKRSDAGKASAEAKKAQKEQSQQVLTKSTSVESVQQNQHEPTKSTVSVNANVNGTVINNKDVRAEQFEIFWKFYPKKVGKAVCKKKFLSLPEKDILQISKTIKKYVAYKPFKDYVHPNPETYLNQKRYDDELPEQNQQIGINLNLAAN